MLVAKSFRLGIGAQLDGQRTVRTFSDKRIESVIWSKESVMFIVVFHAHT